MKRQGKEHMALTPTRKRSYVTWNSQMDALLTSTLFDQMNEGNKGDGDFKSQAYQAVVDKLRLELGISVTIDHVKNRIKVWKKHYAIITKIRTYTKFKWDEERKMVVIPIEDLQEWKKYCEDAPQSSAYQNKCIENWEDICTLFSLDRAICNGAEQHEESASEQHEESAAAMETENEADNTSETASGESNKKLKTDRLVDAINRIAESFKEYASKANDPPRPTCKEIYDVVSSVLGISRHQVLRAVKRFMNGTVDEFDMLKCLPDDQKLDWIWICMDK